MPRIPRGDFQFVKGSLERILYEDAFKAVEETPGAWEFLENESPPEGQGYMFWSHPILTAIQQNMKEMNSHSGASYGMTMRTVEFIAKHGWDAWVWESTRPR
jgi:hypothetical protein